MRTFVLAACVIAALIYFSVLGVALATGARVDPIYLTAMTVVFFFCIVPAFALGWFKRWLPFAVTLIVFGVWMALSVIVGGQISSR